MLRGTSSRTARLLVSQCSSSRSSSVILSGIPSSLRQVTRSTSTARVTTTKSSGDAEDSIRFGEPRAKKPDARHHSVRNRRPETGSTSTNASSSSTSFNEGSSSSSTKQSSRASQGRIPDSVKTPTPQQARGFVPGQGHKDLRPSQKGIANDTQKESGQSGSNVKLKGETRTPGSPSKQVKTHRLVSEPRTSRQDGSSDAVQTSAEDNESGIQPSKALDVGARAETEAEAHADEAAEAFASALASAEQADFRVPSEESLSSAQNHPGTSPLQETEGNTSPAPAHLQADSPSTSSSLENGANEAAASSPPIPQPEEPPSTPPSFSRPTLADLRKAESDPFGGYYQSETAWDPHKDYALMPDGPPQGSSLQKELEGEPRQYIVVILDSDNLGFQPRHMNLGYEGGKFVVNELRERIAQKHNLIPHKIDLRVRMFFNLTAKAHILQGRGIVTKERFYDFLLGLQDSSPHNYYVHVGRGSQAADMRVKAALADAVRDPGCFRVYLGGLDDFGYLEDLNFIQQQGLLESKVNLVQVPGEALASNVYKDYAHRAIDLDYLFRRFQFGEAQRELQDYIGDPPSSSKEEVPCHFHHFGENGCQFGDDCGFSHEPISEKTKERLRKRMKRRKCPRIARGEKCDLGDACFFAH